MEENESEARTTPQRAGRLKAAPTTGLLLRRAPGGARARGALHGVAADGSRVGGAAHGEGDLVAVEASVGQRVRPERAGERLVLLRERERVRAQLPRALGLRRHDPEVRRAPRGAVAL